MLTRLKVKGFKNLVDVDVRFGPFTCIAGANGVGKSNLFDAIQFLAALADHPLLEAAQLVRAADAKLGDFRDLFNHVGDKLGSDLSLQAEMLIPASGTDDLGQEARATTRFVRYSLDIHRREPRDDAGPGLAITKEELISIKQQDAAKHLSFGKPAWLKSVTSGRRVGPYISTGEDHTVRLHGDSGGGGRPRELRASQLARTVISTANADESPTALLARREMQGWRMLQLEPAALRTPDDYVSPARLGPRGEHAPATLARLAHFKRPADLKSDRAEQVFARVANRLAKLVPGIHSIGLDPDERRQLLSIVVVDNGGTPHPARVLSDGTLRFLALAILDEDPTFNGMLCLEEPENGIHPERVEAMVRLLQEIAVDPRHPVDSDNPLRQVIINTHSPSIVSLVPGEDLLLAAATSSAARHGARFECIEKTWRSRGDHPPHAIAKAALLAYLNPLAGTSTDPSDVDEGSTRVKDLPMLQMLLPLTAYAVHESQPTDV